MTCESNITNPVQLCFLRRMSTIFFLISQIHQIQFAVVVERKKAHSLDCLNMKNKLKTNTDDWSLNMLSWYDSGCSQLCIIIILGGSYSWHILQLKVEYSRCYERKSSKYPCCSCLLLWGPEAQRDFTLCCQLGGRWMYNFAL